MKRKGRGTDNVWQFVKYQGDGAYYARCKCGFRYPCYNMNKGFGTINAPEKLYYFCPNCGARKTKYDEGVKKICEHFLSECD